MGSEELGALGQGPTGVSEGGSVESAFRQGPAPKRALGTKDATLGSTSAPLLLTAKPEATRPPQARPHYKPEGPLASNRPRGPFRLCDQGISPGARQARLSPTSSHAPGGNKWGAAAAGCRSVFPTGHQLDPGIHPQVLAPGLAGGRAPWDEPERSRWRSEGPAPRKDINIGSLIWGQLGILKRNQLM